jgi:hypothetical protein
MTRETNLPTTLEQAILEIFRELPPEKQQTVLDFAQYLQHKVASNPPRRSLRGLCADLDMQITEEDIAAARQEMWSNFPREVE